MHYSDKINKKIVEFFDDMEIKSTIQDVGFFAVNRTSCHNSPMYSGLHEPEIIEKLMKDLREFVDNDSAYISWSGKTDEDWFIQVYERN